MVGILLTSMIPDNWGLELAGTLALIPIIVSVIGTRSTLAAVAIASVVALLAFNLPYRFGLPIAVLAALLAGTVANLIVEGRGTPAKADRVTTRIVVGAAPPAGSAAPADRADPQEDTSRPVR